LHELAPDHGIDLDVSGAAAAMSALMADHDDTVRILMPVKRLR